MHSLIEDILAASRARRKGDLGKAGPLPDSRDLPQSAKKARAQGLIPVIAEIKPRILGRSMNLGEVQEYTRAYQGFGACAISVITQPTYFLGSLDNLAAAREVTNLPVLRKDFVVDEAQLQEGLADLVLLIAALPIDLQNMVQEARSLGMEPLVEVHTEEEMKRALQTEARIIGINNRNLKTLDVDLKTFEALAPMAKDAGVFLVAESGVHRREDALRMMRAGADALLVGTMLMERPEMLKEINNLDINDIL